MGFMRWLLLALTLALPLRAQDLPGLGDAGFQAAWDRLLQADDPQALQALHDLAAQGNTAAMLALPLALRWLPPQPDRAALRLLGSERVQDLGRAAWKPAALWADGEMSQDLRKQMERVQWLYELGEGRKADALLNRQLNHNPMAAPLPEGFLDLDASAMVKARVLFGQLQGGDRRALAPLQALLDRDAIEGWMVLSELNETADLSAGPPIQANLHLPATAGARLADGKAAWALLWYEKPRPPLPEEVLAMARRDLLPRSEFTPVRAFCAANCGATAQACEGAFLALFGAPYSSTVALTPLDSLMPEDAFFATPRGAQALMAPALLHRLELELVADPATRAAADPAFQAARGIDACLADAALQSLAPLPPNP